ncbi:hypothetical protein KL925_001604 [Ogataea polymorpha]|uniref:Uncharacterized protein n=1 Tax=Ogataea polymorpha TaxID=460523 RepID=A0A1B7SIW3_9ASCO|nr:uncharacterized protein OGAPODRAFT_75975 [Ogataea polymorpha]KAG7882255.1 hypothetical protein KL937_000826 [Ogataea polymorpha]KAG7891660.1 hypothetical protein KL936_001603 [Ogataea polymorpha]KAG7902504.1 hypothetical protein KL935_001412 [Ogataea polymorpha]KAG7911508.1 hypothetical protein KL906_000829 [Ogataea polymorpha]KAG7919273.1 hypothetical protein KL927_001402 [Ogataea polymorpha]
MFRSLTSNSLKQGQRVSTKALQHQPTPQTRLLNSLVEQQGSGQSFSSKKYNSTVIPHQQRNVGNYTVAPPELSNNSWRSYTPEDSNTHRDLLAFDQCLLQNSTYDLATGRISGGVDNFWAAVKRIIPLYRSLVHTGELDEKRMGEFVSLLRNGLRIHRLELSKLKKNLDKDSTNPIKNIHYLLTCAIREVSYNLLDGSITLNAHGLTHLFKAYKDLGFTFEAVHIWETGKSNPKLYHLFTSEPVLGSIFPFLVESGDFNFEEVWSMYEKIKAGKGRNEKLHNELQVGMIRVCLFKGRTQDALNIFQQLSSDVYSRFISKGIEPPINVKSYMTMAHLSFIGFSKDIDTADVFFKDAVNESMPYLTPLQLNFVKKYLANTWEVTQDFERVKSIWLTTWKDYETKKTSNSSVSSSLNDSFLSIFFAKNPEFSEPVFLELQQLIADYTSIRQIDEPFINVLLSKSTIWRNARTLEYIFKIAQDNNFSKTNVFYRCCLKACGTVDIGAEQILILFRQLLSLNASTGMKYIAHADWIALRDATINSQQLYTFSDPNSRIDIYFKLWKLCAPYFISLANFKNYMYKDIRLNYNYSQIFQQMPNIRTDIELPEIALFNRNVAIDSYIGYAY